VNLSRPYGNIVWNDLGLRPTRDLPHVNIILLDLLREHSFLRGDLPQSKVTNDGRHPKWLTQLSSSDLLMLE
jgi:hypothetical protein